jgi:predicted HTH domain antitoxin
MNALNQGARSIPLTHMKIDLPDRITAQFKPRELLIDLAAGMYAARHLTLGQAAELANLSQGELQRELGRRQIPAHYDLEDLTYDLRAASEIARS